MAGRFQDKVAFITGGSSGIGAELGKVFASQGAKVVLTARRKTKLAAVRSEIKAAGGECLTIQADVCDRASLDAAVAETVEQFGGIDIVVANAGFGVSGLVSDLTTEDFRRQFDTNFFGVVDTLYATLPYLRERRGRFAIIGSVAGRIGMPRSGVYTASKFAVCGLAESLYHELDDQGVSVTLVNPGFVKTEIHQVDNKGVYRSDRKGVNPELLTMPADKAARAIAHAIYKRKSEVMITNHAKAFVFLARHCPMTLRTLARLGTKGKLKPRAAR